MNRREKTAIQNEIDRLYEAKLRYPRNEYEGMIQALKWVLELKV